MEGIVFSVIYWAGMILFGPGDSKPAIEDILIHYFSFTICWFLWLFWEARRKIRRQGNQSNSERSTSIDFNDDNDA